MTVWPCSLRKVGFVPPGTLAHSCRKRIFIKSFAFVVVFRGRLSWRLPLVVRLGSVLLSFDSIDFGVVPVEWWFLMIAEVTIPKSFTRMSDPRST
jgi:hypothetical protein